MFDCDGSAHQPIVTNATLPPSRRPGPAPQDSVCHVWGCAFSITWDGPVAFTDAEVEWGRFVALREVRARLEADATEFTPVGRHILSLYLTSQQEGRPGQGQ
jgi:hypothetical protein